MHSKRAKAEMAVIAIFLLLYPFILLKCEEVKERYKKDCDIVHDNVPELCGKYDD